MHPLSLFPTLLTFGLIAPLLLRLAVGIILIYFGKEQMRKSRAWLSVFYFITGALLVVGLYTQIVVLVGILLNKLHCYPKWKKGELKKEELLFYGLIGVILLSLLFTGPGFLAFDLPL